MTKAVSSRPEEKNRPNRAGITTAAVCAGLLVVFAILSYSAAWTKSATWDEPEHLIGSYLHRHYRDFRINPEDPALFGWLAAAPLRRDDLKIFYVSGADPLRIKELEYRVLALQETIAQQPAIDPSFRRQLHEAQVELYFRQTIEDTALQWPYLWLTLYHTEGNDPDPLMSRSRAVGTLIGVLLGAMIAWWTYQLGGAVSAVVATALYAFCPNFLAHASLVKNDVMLSAALLGLMFALWRFGRRGTWLNFTAIGLLAGAAVGVKYSGVLAGVFVLSALLVRALLPWPWEIVGLRLATVWRRLGAAFVGTIAVGLIAWVFVWACYGFRYAPTPDPDVRLNMARVVDEAKINAFRAQRAREGRPNEPPTEAEIESLRAANPSAVVRLALWLDEHRLLPQAWIYGFLYTYKSTLLRSTFLLGEVRQTGWWYYFPLAMLFKTPTATLATVALALVAAPAARLYRRCPEPRFVDPWALACLLIMPVIYGLSALTTNLNLGLRHVLPIYPFIFIGVALVVGRFIVSWGVVGKIIATVLAVGLIVETAANFPHYIAFFNAPSGGTRGGIRLLGDSNLDWGQDLKLLSQWQQHNPNRKLYLSYFGIADPGYYGIRALHLPGGYVFAEPALPVEREPAVLAISATNLQGIYLSPQLRPIYAELRAQEPIDVLGGSIYLYSFPLTPPRQP